MNARWFRSHLSWKVRRFCSKLLNLVSKKLTDDPNGPDVDGSAM
jgi:hypothetical protein